MIQLAYLSSLLIALFGMVMIDRRFKLAFFHDARKTSLVLGLTVSMFVLWDLAGIGLGIFRKGSSPYSLDFELLPELPLEEPFFLLLLSYLSLVTYLYFRQRKNT